jgi:nucleotide-binding universal stress UspA family protein
MKGKILVPVDFSQHTAVSCRYATHLATLLRHDIILFHSFFDQIYFSDGGFITGFESGIMLTDEIILDFYRQKEARLAEISAELRALLEMHGCSDLEVTCRMESGDPEVQILRAIDRIEPRLIVMGSSGMGKKSLFAGSVARRTMDSTSIPVIAVPDIEPELVPGKVAYMTNFESSDPIALSEIDNLLSPALLELQCVHFCSSRKEDEARDSMETLRARDLPLRPETRLSFHIIAGDDPEEALEEHVRQNRISLIAFIPHKRNVLQNLVRQNITKYDLFMTRVPILAVPVKP